MFAAVIDHVSAPYLNVERTKESYNLTFTFTFNLCLQMFSISKSWVCLSILVLISLSQLLSFVITLPGSRIVRLLLPVLLLLVRGLFLLFFQFLPASSFVYLCVVLLFWLHLPLCQWSLHFVPCFAEQRNVVCKSRSANFRPSPNPVQSYFVYSVFQGPVHD